MHSLRSGPVPLDRDISACSAPMSVCLSAAAVAIGSFGREHSIVAHSGPRSLRECGGEKSSLVVAEEGKDWGRQLSTTSPKN